MRLRLVSVAALIACLSASPVLADPDPMQAGDPVRDIILGSEGAPHELVMYLSTGCSHCLQSHEAILRQNAYARFVESGKVRLIYRLVPSVFVQPEDDEAFRDAAGRSARLALYGRCLHETQGGQNFPVFLVQLQILVRDFQNWFPDAHILEHWPYIENAEQRQIFEHGIRAMNTYPGDEAYAACFTPDNIAVADADFRRNTELFQRLFADGQRGGVPAFVLNGELLDLPAATREDALINQLEALE